MKKLLLLLVLWGLPSCNLQPEPGADWDWGASTPPWKGDEATGWILVEADSTATPLKLYESADGRWLTLHNEKDETYIKARVRTGTSIMDDFTVGDLFVILIIGMIIGLLIGAGIFN